MEDFYSLSALDLDGKIVQFEQFRSKVVLVVNTGSKGICRNELIQLNELQKTHQKSEFVILAFPCRQFCKMESKKAQKISNTYFKKLEVCFYVFGLTKVYGDNQCPVYGWLNNKAPGSFGVDVEWNFTKFLVQCDGITVERISSTCPFSRVTKIVNDAVYRRSSIMQDSIIFGENQLTNENSECISTENQEVLLNSNIDDENEAIAE